MLNLDLIKKLSEKPATYQPGSAVMWTDPYISTQLLDIHLNPDIDLASRKPETIQSTVKWILDRADGEKLDILDLGCGPGLYTELLAKAGHNVTGVDFSTSSIEYAKRSAQKTNLSIDYRRMNYLELEESEKFDLVIMMFTDFGVLSPGDREKLLSNIYRALKPGGKYIFDSLKDLSLADKVSPSSWEYHQKGFWRDHPYLVLSNSFLYEDEKMVLYQHGVIEEGGFETYRFWTHFFSDSDLAGILENSGFKQPDFYNDVLPESDLFSGPNVTFCVTRK